MTDFDSGAERALLEYTRKVKIQAGFFFHDIWHDIILILYPIIVWEMLWCPSSIFLYACESWILKAELQRKMQAI